MRPSRPGLVLLGLFLAPADPAVGRDFELRSLNGPRADVAALILGGSESGALSATGLALPDCISSPPGAGESAADSPPDTAGVSLTIEIEGRSILDAVASRDESTVPESVRIELYAYAMSRAGEVVASLSKWTRLPLAALADRPRGSGVKLVDRLRLAPGEYQIRVLAREARSQQFVLRVLEVEVADPRGGSPTLAHPVFADTGEPWILAAGLEPDGTRPLPLAAALPVVAVGIPRSFALRGCHLEGATIEARLLTRDREPVAGAAVRLEPHRDGAVAAEIEVGELNAGLYLLEAGATAEAGESTRTLPVFVTDAPDIASWTGLSSLAARPAEPDLDLDPAELSRSSERTRAIEAGYLEVLGELVAGRRGQAVAALETLEHAVSVAHDNPRKAVKWLVEAQNRVTRKLLRHDPECLLPLLMLHLELHDRYVAAGDVSAYLLEATRTRLRSLAQVYATDARHEMAPALAAMSLVDLAALLERSGQLVSALIVLREALALDQANIDVLLDLAYQYEHHGMRTEALDLLHRLLELDPRSDEGRLRLALSLVRANRDSEAANVLRQVIEDGSSEWVLAVAYQELGRLHLARQQFDDAARLFQQSVVRLPEVQRLYIGLAYALDRAGRRKESREVIARLPADPGRPSPRLLYRVPDRGSDLRSRADLVRHGTARLPLLAAALAESGAAE